MIIHRETVEQNVDRGDRAAFVKEIAVAQGEVPIALVRKRAADATSTRAPVLLVHGYGQNRYAWHLPARSFSNFLARAGYDVFSLDFRGHGRSGALGARSPRTVSELAHEDLPAAVREVRELSSERPLFLVGHSLGGLVSYAAAPSLGDAVAGIVSFGSPYQFTRGTRTLEALGRMLFFLDRNVKSFSGALPLGFAAEALRVGRRVLEMRGFPFPVRACAPGSMEDDVYAQHMALAFDRGSLEVMKQLFVEGDMWQRLGHLAAGAALGGAAVAFEALDKPLLVVAGTRDDLAPPDSVHPAFARSRARDKTFRTFPAGHVDLLVGRDAPRTTWPLLDGWLGDRLRGA